MPRSLLIVSGAALATTAGATEYWPCATGPTGRSANEAEKRLAYRYAGTFSKLYVRVTANTTSLPSTVRLRKNATSVNLQVTIPLSTSGVYEDITNTDTIASADLMAIQTISGGTGTLTISILSIYFEALTECVTKLATQTQVTPITFSVASTSKFNFLAGNYADIGSDSGCQHRIAKDGTIKNMSVYVSANARLTDVTVKSRKNGADGNLLLTISPSFTGLLEDITHSDTVVEGDLVNNTTVFGTGTQSISFWSLGADYVAGSNQRFTMLDTGNVIIPGLSTTLYIALAGGFVVTSTCRKQCQS